MIVKKRIISIWVFATEFEQSSYIDIYDCALSKALKREKFDVEVVGGVTVKFKDGSKYSISDEQASLLSERAGLSKQEPLNIKLTKIS